MEGDYLIETTNAIDALLEAGDLTTAMQLACQALIRLTQDVGLLTSTINRLSVQASENREGLYQIVGDPNHFLGSFLHLEHRLLLESKITPRVADELVANAQGLREAVRLDEPNMGRVEGYVRALRDASCDLANTFAQQERQQQARQKRRVQLIALGVGGVTVFIINGSSLVATVGLGAVCGAASGKLGEAMMAAAVAGLAASEPAGA